MISRPASLALILAAYLLVAGTFAYFAYKIEVLDNLGDRILANQARIMEAVQQAERHMDQQDRWGREILGRMK